MTYDIRTCEPTDVEHFAAIEKAAGALFVEAGLPEIASHEPTDREFIDASARAGAVFVATADGTPAGFILSAPLDRSMHIYELSVHPSHGRKGLGRRLVDAVCELARHEWTPALFLAHYHEQDMGLPIERRCFMRKDL